MEADTRYIIDNNLKNKGWILDKSDPNCNVDFESPRDKDLREKLRGKHPDYILYETGTKKPIGVIEAKKTGIDLQKALNQGEIYAKILNAPLIFAMNGAYCETRWLNNEKPLILNGEEVKEIIREREALEFLKTDSNEVYTLPKQVIVSRQELLSIFKDLNDTLRAEGLRAGIERLSEFANVLFLKLLSENSGDDYWGSLKNQKDEDVLGFINSYVFNNIQKKYGGDVFTQLSITNPKTLREIIERLDPLVLSTIDTDIKGDAFEYFLQNTTSTDNDLGEYFTPRHIVKTMVHLVNPVFKESVYDPFCGTGGFLTQSFKYIKENTILNAKQREYLKKKTIFGGEITSTARIAKMNMILQGDGHAGVSKINSLANPRDKEFDIVVSNIPFSQKTKYSDLYYNGIAKNNGDATCVLHCLRALKDGGRMALVVPESFLFRKNLKNTKEFLFNNAKLQTIISLPNGVFLPYTPSKTSILYFTGAFKSNTKKIFYFNVKNDGYSLDNHRRRIQGANDLQLVNSVNFKNEKDTISIGFDLITLENIKKNNYNLLGKLDKEILKEGYCFLGDVCDVNWGNLSLTKKIYKDNGKYPCFSASGRDGYADFFEHTGKAIILSAIGARCGKCFWANGKWTAIKNTIIIKLKSEKALLKYIFYIINKEDLWSKKGLAQPFISQADARSQKIPLPSLNMQKRIIEEIEQKEKEILKGKEMIKKAEDDIKRKLKSIYE